MRQREERGSIIVEVLIVIAVTGLVLGAVSRLLVAGHHTQADAAARTTASHYADEMLADTMAAPWASLTPTDGCVDLEPVTRDGRTLEACRSVSWTYGGAQPGDWGAKRVAVRVTTQGSPSGGEVVVRRERLRTATAVEAAPPSAHGGAS